MENDALTATEQANLDRLRTRYAPQAADESGLTPAAKRDLANLRAGRPARLCYGPHQQLLKLGLVDEDGNLTEQA